MDFKDNERIFPQLVRKNETFFRITNFSKRKSFHSPKSKQKFFSWKKFFFFLNIFYVIHDKFSPPPLYFLNNDQHHFLT